MIVGGNHTKATQAVSALRHRRHVEIGFVSPIVSAMLAVERTRHAGTPNIEFRGDAQRYAEHTGLSEFITNGTLPPPRATSPRATYSPLTRLERADEVDAATGRLAECLHASISAPELRTTVAEIAKLLGELMDNVASHARGVGFSALQVYSRPAVRVELAVVDGGVGLLHNARRTESAIHSDEDAIKWCFVRGNTSARVPPGTWPQRLPEDAHANPYPKDLITQSSENHHAGEGLWQLLQLVNKLGGELWLLTGTGELSVAPTHVAGRWHRSPLDWKGVAIEVSLPVEVTYVADPQPGDEVIAGRFGI